MNIFNRIVTILVIIVLWFVVVVVAIVPAQALAWAQQGIDWVAQSLARLDAMQPGWLYLAMRAGVIILATLLAMLLLWRELRRNRIPAVKVKLPSGGEAAVTADSVARRLAWHVDQLADVVSVTPTIRTHGSTVDVTLDLETAPDVDVPLKSEEVMAVTRDVIETQMGLHVNKIKVNVEHAPYPETA